MLKFGDVWALVVQRSWFALSGGITVLIIPVTLSQSEQGFFFTLLSLAAIQSVFEAGITTVFFNYAAQDFARLSQNHSRGDSDHSSSATRLIDIIIISRRWFFVLAGLYAILVGSFGYYFLRSVVYREGIMIDWTGPFLLLIFAISLSLLNLSKIPM
jgi:hypothetical protein